MIEFIQLNSLLILLLVPLGLVGVWRWSVYLFKVTKAKRYRSVPYQQGFSPKDVTLVVPVYNEDPKFFTDGLNSWIAEDPGAIILVIDHSDERCIDIGRQYQAHSSVSIDVHITTRKGKREALVDGIAKVKTKYVTLVDSDTVFEPGAIETLLWPFANPMVGGTAPRQKVWEPKTITQRVYQIQLEERYDVEMPFLDVGGMTTTCISGRTAMYRTAAVQDKLDELENEYFMGTRCVSGDDKCLTRIVQRSGWLVKYQDTALVWTHAAPDLGTYLKQRIRWTRNTWRSDLTALFREGSWIYHNKYLTFHSIDRFIQPFTLILGPIFFVTALLSGFFVAAGLFLVWIFFTRLLKVSSHIARKPIALMVLPHYIVMTYVIAILKIYALFTVWKQGWITRWSKGRLAHGATFLRSLYGKYLPIGATLAVVLVFAHGFNLFYENAIAAVMSNEQYRITNVSYEQALSEAEELEEEIRNPTAMETHVVQGGDTILSIAKRYNVLPSQIEGVSDLEPVPGDEVVIPVAALRTPNSISELETRPSSTLSYVPFSRTAGNWEIESIDRENVITISGEGTAISFRELVDTMQEWYGDTVVEELGDGEVLLKASIAVEKDATLYFTGREINTVKLYSSSEYFTFIASFDGSLLIENTRISSWDPLVHDFDLETENDGRSFILTKDSGRLDIINSELSHLGYVQFADRPRGYPFGGSYGVSWKLEDGTLGEKILTGNIINSSIHHNTFGVYTYGSVGHVMEGNYVHSNVDYGFDPHDDSRYIIIENNKVVNNGNHGIITSKRCVNNLIANNISGNNALHGVMLDQSSNDNVVIGNELYENVDGIVALDSHDNYFIDNRIYNNEHAGIRINIMSANNIAVNNVIRNNYKGVYVYEGSINNHFISNDVLNNVYAVHFKGATNNSFYQNFTKGNSTNIQINEQSLKNYVVFN